MNKESYTAASSLPLKILLDQELVESMEKNKRILPRHIQLNPENICTQDCSWCSCGKRNKSLEMPYEDIIDIMSKFKELGAKSTTITGGGEPLCHPRINEILKQIKKMNIDIGLVTNADLIKRLDRKSLEAITWMRISLGDGRKLDDRYWINLAETISPQVDYSFSYVVASQDYDFGLIRRMIKFANLYNFTHVRIVNDIFNADKLRGVMGSIRERLKKDGISDSKVIYQDRGTWTKGTKRCLISLLKPVVTADEKLAPCCGDQYKDKPPARDYTADWGTVQDIDKIWEEQRFYDGSNCVKCYYQNYNTLLSTLLEGIKHKKFI